MASVSDDELEYLSPTFDPSSLTVPRIRAILVSHDIPYPASAKKPQLIDIFTQELIPRSRRILAARSRTKRTSRGIKDMPSSQEGTASGDDEDAELMPPPPVPDTTRRKTRRSPRASTEDTTDDNNVPKRTSSTRKSTTKHPRTSDSEAGPEVDDRRPLVRKTRRSDITPTVKLEEPENPPIRPSLGGSAFSDENPFQSGSSPLAPSESRRKSAGLNNDRRKSSSRRRRTEGVSNSASTQVKQENGVIVPSAKTFEIPITRLKQKGSKVEAEPGDAVEVGEEFTPGEQLELVRERAANGERDILPPRRKKRVQQSSRVSNNAPWIVIMTLITGYAAWWRREKIEIGYCGVGRPSTTLANVQVPEWASILQPDCEPCPQHAICYPDMVARCDQDFVLKSHPLSLAGLVPLPPTCEPDGEKVRRVKAVADKAVEELRERRAKWECGDLVEENGKAAVAVEIDEVDLKKEVSQKRRKGMSEAEFEDLWRGALGEIMGRDEVTSDIDGNTHTHRLSSSSFSRLPLGCAVRRSARLTLARYRVELAGLILLVMLVGTARNRILTLRDDSARVPILVSTTLDRLATQAALYAQGSSPEPWISVGQMRDDVLRDEFSAKRREAIWKRVKAVVEANANVRPSVREGRAGEVSRVWEWIGSVGVMEDAWSGDRRKSGRYSIGPLATPEGVATPGSEGKGEMFEKRHWDEGRPIF